MAIDVDLLHDLGVYDALWPQFTAGTATTGKTGSDHD
jgi:hypothetical protein